MTGFIGRFLASALAADGHEIIGTGFVEAEKAFLPAELEDVPILPLDMCDRARVEAVVEKAVPDWIFHLAGQAYVIPSYRDPRLTFEVNVLGTISLLDAVRRFCPEASVALACSGAEYGVPRVLPIREDAPLEPVSPYGVSKATQDMLGLQYHLSYGLRTFRLRLFGTTGPGKTGDAPNDFASQIARAEANDGRGVVQVGNLTTSRDISDVRDVVAAMTTVVSRGKPGEAYNIGRGVAIPVRRVLDILLALSSANLEVRQAPERMRPSDEPLLYPDVSKVMALGWEPAIALERSLAEVLDFWRHHHELLVATGVA